MLKLSVDRIGHNQYIAEISIKTPGGYVIIGQGSLALKTPMVQGEEELPPRGRALERALEQALLFTDSELGSVLVPAPARLGLLAIRKLRDLRQRARLGDGEAAEIVGRLDRRDPVILRALAAQRLFEAA